MNELHVGSDVWCLQLKRELFVQTSFTGTGNENKVNAYLNIVSAVGRESDESGMARIIRNDK